MKTKEKTTEEKGTDNKPEEKTGSALGKGVIGVILSVALEFIWKNRNDIVDLVKRIFAKKPKEPVTPKA